MPSAVTVSTVVGNPRRLSRTLVAAETLAGAVADALGAAEPESPIDLAELYRSGIEPGHDGLERAAAHVQAADVLVVATPVYKASYTGLLKLFLDQLPPRALAGTAVVPLTIAGSPAHRLLADLNLRPVLNELGAALPVPSLLLEESEYERLPVLVKDWVRDHGDTVATALGRLRTPEVARA